MTLIKEELEKSLAKNLLKQLNESQEKNQKMLLVLASKEQRLLELERTLKKRNSENEALKTKVNELEKQLVDNSMNESGFMIIGDADMQRVAKSEPQKQLVFPEDNTKFDLINELRVTIVKLKIQVDGLTVSNSRFRTEIIKHKNGGMHNRLVRSEDVKELLLNEFNSKETDQQFLDRVCDDDTTKLKLIKLQLQNDIDKLKEDLKLIRKKSEASDKQYETTKQQLKEELESLRTKVIEMTVQLQNKQNQIKNLEETIKDKQETILNLTKSLSVKMKELQESRKPKHIRQFLKELFLKAEERIKKDPSSYDYERLQRRIMDVIEELKAEFEKKVI